MTNLFPCLRGKRFLDRPSAHIESSSDSVRSNTGYLRPLCNRQRFPIERNISVAFGVSALLLAARPTAIIWFIISVVIDAIKLTTWFWHFTHIHQESLEAIFPSFANRNAAPTPTMKITNTRIVTPLFHSLPCSILWSIRSAMRSVYFSAIRITSARTLHARGKLSGQNEQHIPTVALTFPVNSIFFASWSAFVLVQYQELAKALIGVIDKISHFSLSISIPFPLLIIPQEVTIG